MKSNKTDNRDEPYQMTLEKLVEEIKNTKQLIKDFSQKHNEDNTELSKKIDNHDLATSSNQQDIMQELFRIKAQNDKLVKNIDFLKNEVKQNSMIKRIMSISMTFFIYFLIAWLLQCLANYNIGITEWYKVGIVISIIIYSISAIVQRQLNNVE